MSFEVFWKEYLIEREKYRDDAWTPILFCKLESLSVNDRLTCLDAFLECVKNKCDDWYSMLDALEKYGNQEHIDGLITLLNNNPDKEDIYGLIIKICSSRTNRIDLISEYLNSADMNSIWRYVVKNLPESMNHMFIEAFERFFSENNELGFDFEQFLKSKRDRLELLRNNFSANKKVSSILSKL